MCQLRRQQHTEQWPSQKQQYLGNTTSLEEFTYIEPYLEQFAAQNPGSKMYVNFDANGNFIRCALAPFAATHFLRHGIPLISVDMCHLYMRIRGQLPLASAIDGNRQVMPIQWGLALVKTELNGGISLGC